MHITLLQSLQKSYTSGSSKTKSVLRFTIVSHIVKKKYKVCKNWDSKLWV